MADIPESGAQFIREYADARRSVGEARAKFIEFLRAHEGNVVQAEGFPSWAILLPSTDEGLEQGRTFVPTYSLLEAAADREPRSIAGCLEVSPGDSPSVSVVAYQEGRAFAGYNFSLGNLLGIEIVVASPIPAEAKEPVYEI